VVELLVVLQVEVPARQTHVTKLDAMRTAVDLHSCSMQIPLLGARHSLDTAARSILFGTVCGATADTLGCTAEGWTLYTW
jgi:hypothetical protein